MIVTIDFYLLTINFWNEAILNYIIIIMINLLYRIGNLDYFYLYLYVCLFNLCARVRARELLAVLYEAWYWKTMFNMILSDFCLWRRVVQHHRFILYNYFPFFIFILNSYLICHLCHIISAIYIISYLQSVCIQSIITILNKWYLIISNQH